MFPFQWVASGNEENEESWNWNEEEVDPGVIPDWNEDWIGSLGDWVGMKSVRVYSDAVWSILKCLE